MECRVGWARGYWSYVGRVIPSYGVLASGILYTSYSYIVFIHVLAVFWTSGLLAGVIVVLVGCNECTLLVYC